MRFLTLAFVLALLSISSALNEQVLKDYGFPSCANDCLMRSYAAQVGEVRCDGLDTACSCKDEISKYTPCCLFEACSAGEASKVMALIKNMCQNAGVWLSPSEFECKTEAPSMTTTTTFSTSSRSQISTKEQEIEQVPDPTIIKGTPPLRSQNLSSTTTVTDALSTATPADNATTGAANSTETLLPEAPTSSSPPPNGSQTDSGADWTTEKTVGLVISCSALLVAILSSPWLLKCWNRRKNRRSKESSHGGMSKEDVGTVNAQPTSSGIGNPFNVFSGPHNHVRNYGRPS